MTEGGGFAARHVIHSRDGRLADSGPATTPDHVRDMVQRAGETPRGLVLYIHGGLVGASAALETAKALAPEIADAGGYPVFLVWETALLDSLLDAFSGLGRRIFGALADAVAELPALSAAGAVRQGVDAPRALLEELLRRDAQLVAAVQRAARAPGIVAEADALTPETYRAIFGEWTELRGAPPLDPFERFLAFAFGVLDELRAREPYGRLHGRRQSVLEECVRAVGVGRAAWEDMVGDAERNVDEAGAVAVLLDAIRDHESAGGSPLPVTLIAHSAGSMIACHLVERWRGRRGPLDVVLLAPSVSAEQFARTLRADAAAPVPMGLRIFTMTDAAERADALPRRTERLYEHSLLYFVSGACETRADRALVGMRRFAAAEELTPTSRLRSGWDDQIPLVEGVEYAAIRVIEDHLAADPARLVLTPTPAGAPAGRASSARSHEGFVWATRESIRHIVAHGLADGR